MRAVLKRTSNQTRGLADYACNFIKKGRPSEEAIHRAKLLHTDAIMGGVVALASKTSLPTVLKHEAVTAQNSFLSLKLKARCLGSRLLSDEIRASVANSAACLEWSPCPFTFPVVIGSSFFNSRIDGHSALKAMVLLEEIEAALGSALPNLDGAIRTALAAGLVFGALHNAPADKIEEGIGIFLSNYAAPGPGRPPRATLSLEAALLSVRRAMDDFRGPCDALRKFEPQDIDLANSGADFAIMKREFRLGSNDFRAVGVVQALVELLLGELVLEHEKFEQIEEIFVQLGPDDRLEQPGFSTRRQASESLEFSLARALHKAISIGDLMAGVSGPPDMWAKLAPNPRDFSKDSLTDPITLDLASKIRISRGPSAKLSLKANDKLFEASIPEHPPGHYLNSTCQLEKMLKIKWEKYANVAIVPGDAERFLKSLQSLDSAKNSAVQQLYSCKIHYSDESIDGIRTRSDFGAE